MSHFTVAVVTSENPTEATLTAALQPYHEFECTGTDDKYVKDLDDTEDVRKEWESHKDDEDYKDFEEFADSWYGRKCVREDDKPDLDDEHKFGYCVIDKDGNLIKAINRTNPEKKWDWWVVGGRWRNSLLLKDGSRCDSAKKSEIDFDKVKSNTETEAIELYDRVEKILSDSGAPRKWQGWPEVRESHDNIDEARRVYHNQLSVKVLNEANKNENYGLFGNLEYFLKDKQDYVTSCVNDSICHFAVLKDGKWCEKGSMGWWACVSEEKEDWPEIYAKLLGEIPDDHYITIVDCHI